MKRQMGLMAAMVLICCVGAECPNNNNGNNNNNNNNNDNSNTGARVGLNVVKLTTETTTDRGPAVGDGVIAFNAEGNSVFAWLRAGETEPQVVPAPSGMDNDSESFAFSGKKLIVLDRGGDDLYVFDTETEEVEEIPNDSINLFGSPGALWEADGDLLAVINGPFTNADGPGVTVKVVDISDVNNYAITPFTVEPGTGDPSAIDIDADNNRLVVRTDDTFYVYDVTNPTGSPEEFTRGTLQGGTGSADIQIQGDFVVFFDDDENFTVLNLTNGEFTQPNRNPARANRGVSFEEDRFAFFTQELDDDGSSISLLNRCLVGSPDALDALVDPEGTFVNGEDATDGRFGFGSFADVSQNGRFVFISGETIVDVNEQERLFMSENGGDFLPCVEVGDLDIAALNVIRASGASCSNNLVAWNYPINPDESFSPIGVAYAELPPP